MIIIESHSILNSFGESGVTSLSEALKVNSSLTQLNLELSLLLNMINWLLFNHIQFITILVHQEQHHYQKDWRLIHHSLNWSWDVSLLMNMINWILLNHITFGTILENQEQHHYQKHWRLIHPSLNYTCGVSLLLNMINWLLFNHIPFITWLKIQEQTHWPVLWKQT